jgi:hypothetical protein
MTSFSTPFREFMVPMLMQKGSICGWSYDGFLVGGKSLGALRETSMLLASRTKGLGQLGSPLP